MPGIKSFDVQFIRKCIAMMNASAFSFVISFLFSMVLLRMYTPSDYGSYATFLATVNILTLVGTGQLQHAFFTKDPIEWSGIIALMILIGGSTVFLSLCTLIWNVIYSDHTTGWMLLTFPLALIFSIIQSVVLVLATREQRIKLIAWNKIWIAFLPALISIILNYFNLVDHGLIWGYIIGTMCSLILLLRVQPVMWPDRIAFNLINLKSSFNSVKDFFRFTFLSELLNGFANQLPLLMLSYLTTAEIVGNYKLANKILSVPSSVIAGSVGSIFKQELIPELAGKGNARSLYLKSFTILSISGFIPFLILILLGKPIIGLLFGPQWTEATTILNILVLLYYAKLIVSPLTYITQVTGKQLFSLRLAIFQIIIILTGFSVSYLFSFSWNQALIIYVLLFTLISVYTFYKCLAIASEKNDLTAVKIVPAQVLAKEIYD